MIKGNAANVIHETDLKIVERQNQIMREIVEKCNEIKDPNSINNSKYGDLFVFIADKAISLLNLQRAHDALFNMDVLDYSIEKTLKDVEDGHVGYRSW